MAGYRIKDGRVKALLLLGMALLFVGVGLGVYLTRTRGVEVAALTVYPAPGELELSLRQGDLLSFEADTSVVLAERRKKRPGGCTVALTLREAGSSPRTVSCDLFWVSGLQNTELRYWESGPDYGLTSTGQRLGCHFTATSTGPASLSALTSLASCVPSARSAILHVFQAAPEETH